MHGLQCKRYFPFESFLADTWAMSIGRLEPPGMPQCLAGSSNFAGKRTACLYQGFLHIQMAMANCCQQGTGIQQRMDLRTGRFHTRLSLARSVQRRTARVPRLDTRCLAGKRFDYGVFHCPLRMLHRTVGL